MEIILQKEMTQTLKKQADQQNREERRLGELEQELREFELGLLHKAELLKKYQDFYMSHNTGPFNEQDFLITDFELSTRRSQIKAKGEHLPRSS